MAIRVKINGKGRLYRDAILVPNIKVIREGLNDTSDETADGIIFTRQTYRRRLAKFLRDFSEASAHDRIDEFCKKRGCDFIVKTDSEILTTSFPVKTLEELEMTFV